MTALWDNNYLAITIVVTVAMQMSFFAIAATFKFDKVTDLAGSMNFVVLAVLTLLLRETYFARQLVITGLVIVWGLRLGGFLLYRVLQRGKDERFDEIRENFFAFLGFWIFQIVWVWVVSLPVIFLNASTANPDIGAADIIGWALWGVGFLFEVAADHQKHVFSNNPANRGKLLNTGVWYYSRHPNYFGEITLWTGVFVSASSVFGKAGSSDSAWVSVVSPVLTFLLLTLLSGMPLAELRYDKRFGTDPVYVDYKKSTSPLIPLPPCLYRHLARPLQCLFLCEWPVYSRHFNRPPRAAAPKDSAVGLAAAASPTAPLNPEGAPGYGGAV